MPRQAASSEPFLASVPAPAPESGRKPCFQPDRHTPKAISPEPCSTPSPARLSLGRTEAALLCSALRGGSPGHAGLDFYASAVPPHTRPGPDSPGRRQAPTLSYFECSQSR